jgi:hypothetical protein
MRTLARAAGAAAVKARAATAARAIRTRFICTILGWYFTRN